MCLFLICWATGNPAGAVPDEAAHLVKALGTARLELPLAPHLPPGRPLAELEIRIFTVPGRLVAATFGCNAFKAGTSSSCLHLIPSPDTDVLRATQVGTYPPLPYVLAGQAALRAPDAATAVLWGRLANVLLCILLVALAFRALRQQGRCELQVAGMAIALTPTTLFLGASLNPSGIEIVSGIALSAVVAAASRPGIGLSRHPLALVTTGTALATSRPLGPIWLTLAAVSYLVMVPGLRGSWRRQGRSAFAIVAALAVAALSTVAWSKAMGSSVPVSGLHPAIAAAHISHLGTSLARQVIGVFGWIDTPLPLGLDLAWYVLIAVWGAGALWMATLAQRLHLVGLVAGTVVLAVTLEAVLTLPSATDVQARYFMIPLLSMPVLAGELLARGLGDRGRRYQGWALGAVLLITAAVHCFALVFNARRHALGLGNAHRFLAGATWAPAMGWEIWLGLVATDQAGCVPV